MSTQFKVWIFISLILSAGLLYAVQLLRFAEKTPAYARPAFDIVIVEAIGLALCAIVMALLIRRFSSVVPTAETDSDPAMQSKACIRNPYWTLFIISFVVLFVELLLIRYCNSQIRIFSFYKNVPLIGCFLGLGLGCFLSRGKARHALMFLVWLLPLSVFLSAGSLVTSNVLGKHAATGSAEHILGDFVPRSVSSGQVLISQILISGFCVASLVVITLLFALLGKLMGAAFERVPRLQGYSVNILGSLVGILCFAGLSYMETPPWIWFVVGLIPLLWWLSNRAWKLIALGLIVINALAVFPDYGETVWSRYQKLVGHHVQLFGVTGENSTAYLVEISDVFYQIAIDRRPETLAKMGRDPLKHYDAIYENIPTPGRVLAVGTGTGNDVAAALRAGAKKVDAVDIDPAIIEMGRRNHPEHPYDNPRVHVIVDDARHAFRQLPKNSYDVVLFGLLDSHTQLGMSSVRLDNYVFTMESLTEAKRLLKPGGHLIITAATFQPWFRERFENMLKSTINGPIQVFQHGIWYTYLGAVDPSTAASSPSLAADVGDLPTDDWPFLYLPKKEVPKAYLWIVVCLAITSIIVLKACGLPFGRFTSYHGHLFFLGAAFLLMEVHAINRLALLFGTTWLVSAVTIAIVLFLIVCANLMVMAFGRIPYWIAYGMLGLSLGISYWVQPGMILGEGVGMALVFGLVLLSPVFFAGLVFARSFSIADMAGPAIGANIMGSVLGGWIEYSTMAFGMRALVVLAAFFYLLSFLLLLAARRRSNFMSG